MLLPKVLLVLVRALMFSDAVFKSFVNVVQIYVTAIKSSVVVESSVAVA